MSESGEESPVSFSLDNEVLTVRDEAGGGEMTLAVDDVASTTPATGAWFDVPVDHAVSLEASTVEIPQATSAAIRSDDGEHYGAVTDEEFTVGGGTYVDLDGALKLLLYVEEGPMEGGWSAPRTTPSRCGSPSRTPHTSSSAPDLPTRRRSRR